MTPVWLFLVRARALASERQSFAVGSEIQVQCMVPEMQLESALVLLDQFLWEERFSREDLSIARRYDLDDPDEEYPMTEVEKAARLAAGSGKPCFGVFFISDDSAAFIDEVPS